MLSSLQTNGGPGVKLYSLASCQPLLRPMSVNTENDYCDEFNRRTYNEIIALKAQGLKGVVLSGRWVILRHPSISRYDATPEHVGIRSLIRQIRSKRAYSNVAATDVLAPRPRLNGPLPDRGQLARSHSLGSAGGAAAYTRMRIREIPRYRSLRDFPR
jgi:hypothetical protein